MKKFVLLVGLLFCSATFASTGYKPIEGYDVVAATTIHVPYGQSQWTHTLQQPRVMNPFRLLYQKSLQCPNVTISLRVRYIQDPTWLDVSPNVGGWVYHRGGLIDSVMVVFHQYQYQNLVCDFFIEGKKE